MTVKTTIAIVSLIVLTGCKRKIGMQRVSSSDEKISTYEDLGKIAYNVPDSIIVGKSEIIELRISRDKLDSLLDKGFFGKGKVLFDSVRITGRMKVNLLSADDLEIYRQNDSDQVLEESGFNVWLWKIRALSSGHKTLAFSFGIQKLEEKISGGSKFLPTKQITFYVKANPLRYSIILLEKNWQYILSTMIIPLAIFAFRERRKKSIRDNIIYVLPKINRNNPDI